MIINFFDKEESYESPVIMKQEIELEQVMAGSGRAKHKLGGASREEIWDETGDAGSYEIEM